MPTVPVVANKLYQVGLSRILMSEKNDNQINALQTNLETALHVGQLNIQCILEQYIVPNQKPQNDH